MTQLLRRTLPRGLLLALLVLGVAAPDLVGLGPAAGSVAEAQGRPRRGRRQRRQRPRRRRPARETAPAPRRAPASGDSETVRGLVDATPPAVAPSSEPAAESSGSGGDGNGLTFDERVIRGQTAGEGAVILVDRGQRAMRPLVRRRRRFLRPTYRAVLGAERVDGGASR